MTKYDLEESIEKLENHRETIIAHMEAIQNILKQSSQEQYVRAYSVWIPQVMTGLINGAKWLPRGDYCMQDTLNHLKAELKK